LVEVAVKANSWHVFRTGMTTKLEIELPATLALHSRNRDEMESRSRFLLALKYFELGELSSGQASRMCGMGRVLFLSEAARMGVPATELEGDELDAEFADV
jgi:predicted HTH domain antitoxin